VSDRSLYRRFFNLSRDAADAYVEALLSPGNRVFRRFGADVVTENYLLLKMVHQLGFPTTTLAEGGTIVMSFALQVTADVLAAVDERDRAADAASLGRLLAPHLVVVIGAGSRARTRSTWGQLSNRPRSVRDYESS
jgi:hypothetical protein